MARDERVEVVARQFLQQFTDGDGADVVRDDPLTIRDITLTEEEIAYLLRARDRRAVRLVRAWRSLIGEHTLDGIAQDILGRAPKGGKGR